MPADVYAQSIRDISKRNGELIEIGEQLEKEKREVDSRGSGL